MSKILLFLLAFSIKTYKIGPNNAIYLRSLVHPELKDTLIVRPDSTVSLPLIGDYKLNPMPLQELKDTLNKIYSSFYTYPAIDLIPLNLVIILGEVKRPGRYFLPVGSDIIDAIAVAGGFMPTANIKKIKLKRGGEFKKVNFEKLLGTKEKFFIASGDVIYVPQKSIYLRITNFQTIVSAMALAWSIYVTFVRR